MLYAPSNAVAVTLAADYTRQRLEGQHAGGRRRGADAACARTASMRQLRADLNYTPPSFNAFDRVTDVDTPIAVVPGPRRRVAQRRLEGRAGPRDLDDGVALLGLEAVERSRLHRPADHHGVGGAVDTQTQWTQEVRYAGDLIRSAPPGGRACSSFHQAHRLRLRRSSRNRARPPRASCSRRAPTRPRRACSTATATNQFMQLPQHQRGGVRPASSGASPTACALLPGLRFNYDQKDVDFDQQVYGGLQTSDPALIALQRSVLAPQAYTADVDEHATRPGNITVAYKVTEPVNTYATYATELQVGRPEPERRADRRAGPAGAVGRDGAARRRASRRGRREDRAVPRRHRERHGRSTRRSTTSRRRS